MIGDQLWPMTGQLCMIKLVMLLLFLVSCQTNDSKVTTTVASHIGEWETDCYSNVSNYGITNLYITSTSIEVTTEVYSDSNCNTLIGEFYLKANSYVRTLNTYLTTPDTYEFTPLNATYAAVLNGASYCGPSPNWQNGVTQSLFDRTCAGNDPELINQGETFTLEAVRTDDTLEYSEKTFYKI